MTDKELIDFIEQRGLQIWPQRKSKHGPVAHWWVQNVLPFVQAYDSTFRGALHKLEKVLTEK